MTGDAPRKKELTNNRVGYNQKVIGEIMYFSHSRPNKCTEKNTPIYYNPNYSVSGSLKLDNSIVDHLPSSAQQQTH